MKKLLLFLLFLFAGENAFGATAPSFITSSGIDFSNSGTPRGTANISTQSGDILVACGVTADAGTSLTISDGGGTQAGWTQNQIFNTAGNVWLSVWTATATTGSISVTGTRSATSKVWGIHVEVWRGSDGVGASNKANGTTAAPQVSVTTTQADSALVSCFGDWNATTGTRTYLDNAGTFVEKIKWLQSGQYAIFSGYNPDAVSIGGVTVGSSTVLTGQVWVIAAVEVKGTGGEGGGSTIHTLGALGVGN